MRATLWRRWCGQVYLREVDQPNPMGESLSIWVALSTTQATTVSPQAVLPFFQSCWRVSSTSMTLWLCTPPKGLCTNWCVQFVHPDNESQGEKTACYEFS